MYYKIYCGAKIADIILDEYLSAIITTFSSKNYITKWFFIRYHDPESHIRLRLQIENSSHLLEIINDLNEVFEKLISQNIIWKVQVDTYQRELERYGKETIEDSENLFCLNSNMNLEYLKAKKQFQDINFPIIFSILSIDTFLNEFCLLVSEKQMLLHKMYLLFKEEFNINKKDIQKLNLHYNNLELTITNSFKKNIDNQLNSLNKLAKNKKVATISKRILNNISIPIDSFLSSHIHMMLNRQYTSRQREYELLIYHHLFKHYSKQRFEKIK